jgi:hypothetical protein
MDTEVVLTANIMLAKNGSHIKTPSDCPSPLLPLTSIAAHQVYGLISFPRSVKELPLEASKIMR